MKKTNIKDLRQEVLSNGRVFLDRTFKKIEKGIPPFSDSGEEEIFKCLAKMIENESSPVNFEFKGGNIEEKIDSIVYAISCGKLTPEQGTILLGILRTQFEVTEVNDLLDLINGNKSLPQIEER